eukprot:1883349-Rhodomonas_salina.1
MATTLGGCSGLDTLRLLGQVGPRYPLCSYARGTTPPVLTLCMLLHSWYHYRGTNAAYGGTAGCYAHTDPGHVGDPSGGARRGAAVSAAHVACGLVRDPTPYTLHPRTQTLDPRP